MSQRHKIQNNTNDSKNTRLSPADIAKGDSRTDTLAHLSRYQKIADMLIREARRVERPLRVLEVGCGEIWPLRLLYKAYVCKKSDIVSYYHGVDIDDVMLKQTMQENERILEIFNARLKVQDVTVDPNFFDVPNGSIDFFISTEVIEHMQPQFVGPWLDGVHRAMKPGGLLYISTPNHDGSRDQLPIDHIYEWGYWELRDMLEQRWKLEQHSGTFIQMNNFNKANKQHGIFSEDLLEKLKSRFDSYWLRNVLAAPYPEYANNVAWILRKV